MDPSRFRSVQALLRKERSVQFAYLFGSRAAGRAGPLSDTDIAVYLDPRLSKARRQRIALSLASDLSKALRTDRLDVVVMNDAPDSFNFEVIKHGSVLADKRGRVLAEAGIMSRSLDRKPVERFFASRTIERVARTGLWTKQER